jgi:acyl-CoA reductase-like NAD-dependent aldehyde dehydrogenase
MRSYKMWINGQWLEAESKETFEVVNPATEEIIAKVASGSIAEVDKAVAAARLAFPEWSSKTQAERCKVVNRIATALFEHIDELADLDTLDHGTPKSRSRSSILGAIENLEYAAQASRGLMGNVIPVKPGATFFLQREPVGVCGLIIPWNAPLPMICAKMGYALATGNTCIIKPPTVDSLTALRMGEILETVGLPVGTVNIVTGSGIAVGDAMARHSGIDLISFTGSTETGKSIMESAAGTVKRLTLELGGKNPFIVLDDADLELTVEKAVFCSYANSGMICAAPGRYYIHESLYDRFVERFVKETKKVIVGDPTNPKTAMGPVVSGEHRDMLEKYIEAGIDEGATLLLGGERPTTPPLDRGYYVMPAVFSEVTQDMIIAREEIFGPVACLMKFSTVDEVIGLANDSTYGLCASLWTRNAARGLKIANALDVGFVWINQHLTLSCEQPWGGFKQSGFGKDNSVASLESYTRVKAIHIDLTV